jgi:hypothetical protein
MLSVDAVEAPFWPGFVISRGPCALQARFGEECGLHMTSNFFVDHFKVKIADGASIDARSASLSLRRFAISPTNGRVS